MFGVIENSLQNRLSFFFSGFGHLVAHDMSRVDNHPTERAGTPCFPPISRKEYLPGNPRKHANRVTSWLDLSSVY